MRANARDAYLPPKLTFFGPVGALTQSGSGDTVEMGMMMGMMGMSGEMRRP